MLREPLIVRGHERPAFWLLNDHLRPLVDARHTNGQLAVSLNRVLPGIGPPPHVHADDDEGFFVINGEMTFLAADRLVVAGAGSFFWGPRGVVHGFKCTSATPAEVLLIVTPAKFGEFVATMAKPAPDFACPPPVEAADFDKLMRVAPTFGITMLPTHPMPTAAPGRVADGRPLWVMGEHVRILATSAQTGGQFTVVDVTTAPGGGPPSHAHTREDELFYVIDGRHEVRLGDRTDTAGPGDLVCVPRGTRHRYTNLDAAPGRLLSIHTPGGLEAFFEDCGVDATKHAAAPRIASPPPEEMVALLARHGMTM